MKQILIVFILLCSIWDTKAQMHDSCILKNKGLALSDIKKGKPELLLVSGIAAKYYADDPNFSKKYKITFHDFGCIADKAECMMAYNEIIFNYLDKTYGTAWRKEVRQDIFGLHPMHTIK